MLGEILVEKVVECLPTTLKQIESPEAVCQGEFLATPLDLVSVMRSGDALLEIFLEHFPEAKRQQNSDPKRRRNCKARF